MHTRSMITPQAIEAVEPMVPVVVDLAGIQLWTGFLAPAYG